MANLYYIKKKFIFLFSIIIFLIASSISIVDEYNRKSKNVETGYTLKNAQLVQHIQKDMPVYTDVNVNEKIFILLDEGSSYLVYLPALNKYGYLNKNVIFIDQ